MRPGFRAALAAALLALPLPGAFAPAALAQSLPELYVLAGPEYLEAGAPSQSCFVGVSQETPQTAPVTVNLRIGQTGDFLAPGETGDKTFVRDPGFDRRYRFGIDDDDVDEPNGTVTCTLLPGDGYTIGSNQGSSTAPIIDNDPTIASLARVGSGAVSEGEGIEFTVTLSRELVAGEQLDVPLQVGGVLPNEWRLSKKVGPSSLNKGVRLRPDAWQYVNFQGAGARVATLVLTPLRDGETEGEETITVALAHDAAFDNTRRTNVGGGADPHPSRNSFGVAVTDAAIPARCTNGSQRWPGCVWITGRGDVSEGRNVTFTVHADPAPAGDPAMGHGLTVKVTVFEPDTLARYLATYPEGHLGYKSIRKTVRIPAGQTSASFTVPTVNDRNNEEHSHVRARLGLFGAGSTHRGVGPDGEYFYTAREPGWGYALVYDTDPPPLPHVPDVVNASAEYRFAPLDRTPGRPVVATGDKVAEGEKAEFCIGRESGRGRLTVTAEYVYRPTGTTDPWTRIGGKYGIQLSDRTPEMCLKLDTAGQAGRTVALRVLTPGKAFQANGTRFVYPYVPGSNAIATREVTADTVSTVSFAAGDRSVTEGDAPLELEITLDPPPPAPVTLRFRVSGRVYTRQAILSDYKAGRARWGSDYYIQRLEWDRTLEVPADAATATLTMHVIDDAHPDSGETVEIEMLAGGRVSPHATLGGMTVTILNDEPPPGQEDRRQRQGMESYWTDYHTVVNLIIEARDNPTNAWAKGGGNAVHVAKWNRVLEAIGYDTGTGVSPMPASEIHANAAKWPESTFKAASVYLKSLDGNGPVVTVTGGSAVTEGSGAGFTVRRTGDTAAALTVLLAVSEDGTGGRDFVAAGEEGDKEVVIQAGSAEAAYTVPTGDDAADEPDGTVTLALRADGAYTSGSPSSATVTVRDDDGAPPLPVVTVTGGSAVTEGGSASFTLTANPVPTSPLPVSVTIATAGDYGVTAGSRTVSIPTTGSATLTLSTTDDATDEPDGSVTATVQTGNGYTVGTSASGTVAIRDDDLPPPVVTIAAKAASVTEGGDAAFTLTADRAPDADLTVRLSVSETGTGDHVAAADEGAKTAVIAKGATEAVFRVATANDAVDEPDTSATVAVQAGAGYTVGAPASASVTVLDDDVTALPVLSVADETAREGVDWLMTFTVRLSAPASEAVEVRVDTRPSTPVSAEAKHDYWPLTGKVLRFGAGETEKPVQVLVYDDSHDEEAETFELVLSDARGANIADGVAIGTIVSEANCLQRTD